VGPGPAARVSGRVQPPARRALPRAAAAEAGRAWALGLRVRAQRRG
jgi:hypothetical protein